jgi:hypothetical protein
MEEGFCLRFDGGQRATLANVWLKGSIQAAGLAELGGAAGGVEDWTGSADSFFMNSSCYRIKWTAHVAKMPW